MSKAEQTRQSIIEKSAALFNLKGYASTSLSDLQETIGLTKGAIYGNFSSKNELAIVAFEYISNAAYSRVKAEIEKQSSAAAALVAFADYYSKNWKLLFERGGCPMLNAAVEADDHLDFLRNSVRQSMKRTMKLLQLAIEKGQKEGEFKEQLSAEQYAAIIFSSVEGSILLSKVMNDPKYLRMTKERIEVMIKHELSA